MTLIKATFDRELGIRRGNRDVQDVWGTPVSQLERFKCLHQDALYRDYTESQGPPFACKFSTDPSWVHFLVTADEDGVLVLFDTAKLGKDAYVKEWTAHSNAVFDVSWMHQESKLLTASGDQSCVLWDMVNIKSIDTFKGHTSSVKSVDWRPHNKFVFASGSRDGHVMIWDSRCNKKGGFTSAVNVIKNGHMIPTTETTPRQKRRSKSLAGNSKDSQQTVTAVLFQDEYSLVTAGAVDGFVKVWDLRKSYSNLKSEATPKFKFPYAGTSIRKRGFSSLAFDHSRSRLFASCTDDVIYQYNCASYTPEPVVCYRGHQNSTFYVKATLSPDDQFLLSGSRDNNAYIWKVDDPLSSPVLLKGHSAEVTSVEWCPADFFKVVTLSDDNTMRIWRVDRGEEPLDVNNVIGTAERSHREIGVSASMWPRTTSHAGPLTRSALAAAVQASPLGATSLPSSPRRLASPFRSTRVNGVQAMSPCFNPSPKMKTPSIKAWFCRPRSDGKESPLKSMSPSPRKLLSPRRLLSPRKLRIMPMQGKSDQENVPRPRPVKRKLSDIESDDGDGYDKDEMDKKKRKTSDDNEIEMFINRTPKMSSPVRSGTEHRVFSSKNTDVSCSFSAKKSLFSSLQGADVAEKLKINTEKVMQSEKVVQSPTSNLPNYVLNPEPRTPSGKTTLLGNKENSSSKNVDWLTRLGLQMQSPGREEREDTKSPGKGRRFLSTSSPGRPDGPFTTPKSSARTPSRTPSRAASPMTIQLTNLESDTGTERKELVLQTQPEKYDYSTLKNFPIRTMYPWSHTPSRTILSYFSPKNSGKKKTNQHK